MKKKPLALWDRDSQPAAPGLDQLLPTHAEQRDLGGTRYVGAAAAALSAVAAVEASTDPAAQICARGVAAEQAWRAAMNGRGPWWNAGAQHCNLALPAAYFTRLGLVSLLREQQRLQCVR